MPPPPMGGGTETDHKYFGEGMITMPGVTHQEGGGKTISSPSHREKDDFANASAEWGHEREERSSLGL